jgi:hypothetical protein
MGFPSTHRDAETHDLDASDFQASLAQSETVARAMALAIERKGGAAPAPHAITICSRQSGQRLA